MISKAIQRNLERSSWIRAMFEEGTRLKKIHGSSNVFDFSIGNPDPEPPGEVIASFKKNAGDTSKGTHGYMSNAGYMELREKIAAVEAKRSGLDIKASNTVITCGAAGGLNVSLATILDPGDEVLILKPFFAEYIFYVQNSGGVPVFVDTDPDTFLPDPVSFEKALSPATKAVIINSPNNPTGVIYPVEILENLSLILKAKEKEYGTDIMVLSDEPYRELVYDGTDLPNIFNIFDNSAIVYSYSKSLSIPGERIGYIVSNPNMKNVDLFMEGAVFCNRTLGFVNAPAFIQRVLLDSMDSRIDPAIYRERRDILYDNLTRLGFRCIKPQGAFYLFPRSPMEDEVSFVKSALRYNLLLVPGRGFGLPGHFRISYCVDKQTILDSIPQFEKLAKDHGM